ncbi:MAG: hypothetical protein ABI528_09060 [bacterium]
MEAAKLKKFLIKIAENIDDETTVEDIYEELLFLIDIQEFEEQVKSSLISNKEDEKKISGAENNPD